MFIRELKVNLKSFIIWTGIVIGLFVFVLVLYPLIFTDENANMINEMMAMMPEELLKAFNMDISSIDTAYGWLKSEGLLMIILVIGVYSAILGANIVLKEENDGTIEYLSMMPITRRKIIIDKILASLIYIFAMVMIVGIANLIGLLIAGNFNIGEYLMLSITPLFVALPLFGINLFISMFLKNTKKSLLIAIGVVFISYFFLIVGEMDESLELIKFLSIFSFADTRNIILNNKMNILIVLGSISLSLLFILLSIMMYKKKELI